MRLIDADKLLEMLSKADLDYSSMGGISYCEELVEDMLTINPIDEHLYLDCKTDCKHFNDGNGCVYDNICCRLGIDYYER